METRANHLMVGAFVLVLAFGLLAFVIWLAKSQFDAVFDRYHVRVEGAVTGLKQGSPVRYQGVKVGEVTSIVIDPSDVGQVLVTVEVEKRTPVRSDTTATLELEGLTGGRYLLLTGGEPNAPPLTAKPGEKLPVITAEASSLQQVFEGAPEVLDNVNIVLGRTSDLLNAQNRKNIADLISNLTAFSVMLADQSDEIRLLIDDAAQTMSNVNETTDALRDLSAVLKTDTKQLFEQADATLVSIESMASNIDVAVVDASDDVRILIDRMQVAAQGIAGTTRELEAMIAENREPIRDFTATGLYELTNLLTEARELILVVNRVTTEVQRDPARFIFGDQQQGYEAQ